MMKTFCLRFSLAVAITFTACDPKEQCVADCDSESATEPGGTETDTSGESESESESGTTQDVAACQDHRDEATLFVEQNRACQTVLDCVSADAICYDGPISNPCGAVGLSAEADMTVWQTIGSNLADACECGANACGSALMCNDAQQCESVFGSEAYCPSIERDAQTFLAANRACDTDDDCVELPSMCYVDECSIVAVNVDTNPEDWARLDQALWECSVDGEMGCNFVGECGPSLSCSDEGQCIATF